MTEEKKSAESAEPKPSNVHPMQNRKPPSVQDIERAKQIQILPQVLSIMQNFGVAELEGMGWKLRLHGPVIDEAMAESKRQRAAKAAEEAVKKLGDDDLTPAQPTPVPQKPMDPNHDYLDDPASNPE